MQATGCTFAIVALLCLIAVGVFLVATQLGGEGEDRPQQPIGVEVTGENTKPAVLPELQITGPTAFVAVAMSPAVAGQGGVDARLLDQVGYEFGRLLDDAGIAVSPASDLDLGRLPDPPLPHPVWTIDVTVERYGHTRTRPGGRIGQPRGCEPHRLPGSGAAARLGRAAARPHVRGAGELRGRPL